MGLAVADFAGDGNPGIFIANDNARNLLLRNRGKGFEEIGIDAGVAYNGDGRNMPTSATSTATAGPTSS